MSGKLCWVPIFMAVLLVITNTGLYFAKAVTEFTEPTFEHLTLTAANEVVVNYNSKLFSATGGTFGETPVKFAEQSFGVKVDQRREGIFTAEGTVTLQSCAYLNMWVYVPAETIPEGTLPRLRFRVGDNSTGTENTYSVYVNVDWTGWKLLTIPFSELRDSNGAALPASAVVTKFRIITNENNNPQFNTKSSERIYLDRVWFSQEVPSVITVQLQPENGGEKYYAMDKMLILVLDRAATLDAEANVTIQAADGTIIANTLRQLAPDKIQVLLHESLVPGTQYTVTLSYGAVYDETYGCNPEAVFTMKTESVTALKATAFFPPLGSKNVSPVDTYIKLTFNNPLKTISEENVLLQSNDGTVYDGRFFVTCDGKEATVRILNDLFPDTEYTLTISGVQDVYGQFGDVSYNFRTAPDTVASSGVVFLDEKQNELSALPDNGEIIVKATVKNYDEVSEANPVLVVILYDTDKMMKKLYKGFAEGNVPPLASKEVTVCIPAGDLEGTTEIRAFVSQEELEFMMLGNRYAQLGGQMEQEVTVDWKLPEEHALQINLPVIEQDVLILSGRTNIPYAKVLLMVKDSANHIQYLIPVTADESGEFRSVCRVGFRSGFYSYTAVVGNKVADPKEFRYLNESEQEAVCMEINKAENFGQVETIIRPYLSIFGFETLSEAEVTDLAVWIYESKPYAMFENIRAWSKKYVEVKSALASKIWSEIPNLLEQYGNLLLGTCTEYLYYLDLSTQGEKARVCEKMAGMLPFPTILEFREGFRKAVAAYQEEINKPVDNGGRKPRSGGFVSIYTKPAEKSEMPVEPVTQTQPVKNQQNFMDIQDVPWAEAAIRYLHENGVISDAEDGKFRPFNSITREEFVKMLICAFDEEMPQSSSCTFRDATPEAWYYPYLSYAEQKGLVFGLEDARFGIGMPILRQDMAVIVYRALQAYGGFMQSSSEHMFTDESEISDYAYEAVQALCVNGIIIGDENNRFAPKAFLTRAEAAQIIYRVMVLRG